MIELICPHCNKRSKIADEFAGSIGNCKYCGNQVDIPTQLPFSIPDVDLELGEEFYRRDQFTAKRVWPEWHSRVRKGMFSTIVCSIGFLFALLYAEMPRTLVEPLAMLESTLRFSSRGNYIPASRISGQSL